VPVVVGGVLVVGVFEVGVPGVVGVVGVVECVVVLVLVEVDVDVDVDGVGVVSSQSPLCPKPPSLPLLPRPLSFPDWLSPQLPPPPPLCSQVPLTSW
jgi:hypothetical protein